MNGDAPWEPVLSFITFFVGWAFAEVRADTIKVNQEKLHPHDVTLGIKLRELFTEPTKIFLREHSFGQAYPHSRLHPVRDVSYWEGSEYEFDNMELDNICSEIVRLSDELYTKLSGYAGPIRKPEGYFAVPLDYERAQDLFGPETTARVAELNSISEQIVEKLDKFEKAFRRLSPESYQASLTAKT
ncbi:hypothetical protein LJR251_000550 [Rhizobium rhizogenes]|uniref:hypothetical protein n=1 Tax=Rhizobium rhizogenes TaxID=359 RepID=UPI003ECC45BA